MQINALSCAQEEQPVPLLTGVQGEGEVSQGWGCNVFWFLYLICLEFVLPSKKHSQSCSCLFVTEQFAKKGDSMSCEQGLV